MEAIYIFQKKELSMSIENKIADLEKEEPCHNTLLTSQGACLFEQRVHAHVLPKVYETGKFASIPQLLDYLTVVRNYPRDQYLRMIQ